jgi:hypothetical protein
MTLAVPSQVVFRLHDANPPLAGAAVELLTPCVARNNPRLLASGGGSKAFRQSCGVA